MINNTNEVPFLETKGITKSFGSINALSGVDFSVNLGQIVAIVGDNGSGKSTFIKILSGSLLPDDGVIRIYGKDYSGFSARMALDVGISTVYQDLSLDNYRDVAANIFLGNEKTWGGFFLRRREMRKIADRLIKDLNIGIPNITLPVGSFSGGQRQGVAIARAVHHGKKLIILDEPTAALGIRESAAVLKLISDLAARGMGIIIICHNLHQVVNIADKICIMRHGRILKTILTGDTTPEDIHQMILDSETVD